MVLQVVMRRLRDSVYLSEGYMKPTISSISVTRSNMGSDYVYGLGSDNKVYLWHAPTAEWVIYKIQ